MIEDNIIFVLLMALPPLAFWGILRRHWVDRDLLRAFLVGLGMGLPAIFLTRLAYLPIESYLGTDLRSFIASPGNWWTTLAACILVIGFIEEFLKIAAGAVSSYLVAYLKRPTIVFLGFSGCALSFSLLENIQYFIIFGSGVVLPRILISSTAHLAFVASASIIITSGMCSSKSDSFLSVRILFGVVVAAVMHGLFDFLVFHYDVNATSGLIIALVAFFFMVIHESWIFALRNDPPEEAGLTICSGCGAFSVDQRRFCGFCGHRVVLSRHEVSVVNLMRDIRNKSEQKGDGQ